MRRSLPTFALLALAVAGAASPAVRAETIACTAITAVPVTIDTQGVYCLTRDIATNLQSGAAITVATNNVSLDCNGYKLGNLAATPANTAVGVLATARLNVTVRGCGIRGFHTGVELDGGGHLVEDNRFDGNRKIGVKVSGDGSTVRRNRIYDTAGGTTSTGAVGIHTSYGVDVIDNLVSGVVTLPQSAAYAFGVFSLYNFGGTIEGNRIRGLVGGGPGQVHAISVAGSDAMSLRDNTLASSDGGGTGLKCDDTASLADGNHVFGFATASVTCTNGTTNVFH